MDDVTQDDKFKTFVALHERPGLFVIPNPWDAGSARILTALGFEALATTSAGYAFSIGRPDTPQDVTRAGLIANAGGIAAATSLPVSADLENGFGDDPDACAETIRQASAAGLAGGSIEDFTGDETNPIYEFGLAVDRVRAACEAARGLPFFVTARCENYLSGRPDLADTINRLQAFAEAGAHAVYAPGLSGIADIRSLCAAVNKPVNVLMGLQGKTCSLDELREAGVKRVSVGGSLARAALDAFRRAAIEIRNNGTFTYAQGIISHGEVSAYMKPVTR